jgi:hypothetical protein
MSLLKTIELGPNGDSFTQASVKIPFANPVAVALSVAPMGDQITARRGTPRLEASKRTLQQAAPVVARPIARGPSIAITEQGIDPPENWLPMVQLPKGSEGWTQFEKDLYLQSDGVYSPEKLALLRRMPLGGARGSGTGSLAEVRGRVSVVTPTMSSRQRFHEQLWACFEAQDWPDKELIVVETYDSSPSAFLAQKAKEDSRFVHLTFHREAEQDFTVGLKRDMTLHLASGEFIVNFDDDDVYAPNYISVMVGELKTRGLEAITLSTWHNFYVQSGTCGYSDADSWGPLDAEELDEVLYGYGFSYVHRRRIALLMPYPNICFAEDAPFLLRIRKTCGDDKVALKQDEDGICMHIMHRANSTDDCEFSRQLTEQELLKLQVSTLPLFQQYLDRQSMPCWWRPVHELPILSMKEVWQWAQTVTAASAREQTGERSEKLAC